MVDELEEQMEMMCKLQIKVADLEHHSRLNNLTIRGISEAVKQIDLVAYPHQLFLQLIPNMTPRDILLDRAHRIPKPSQLPDTVFKDVLVL